MIVSVESVLQFCETVCRKKEVRPSHATTSSSPTPIMDKILASISQSQGTVIAVVIVVVLVLLYIIFFRNFTPANLNWIRNPVVDIVKRRAEKAQRKKERAVKREARAKRKASVDSSNKQADSKTTKKD